ncbi:adenylate/guanylate cyclase domain-containing protein [Streptomyces sp. NBC_00568]|uniref:adenylate/guanylate cyclase domain-containing protein n=1 Tax=Streptomyces sp. NBC_00568 TaxID=2975779 RepID=UPI00224FAD92|nr:adenylate/guanylate cyclase domain-containing protein [Streptomyces sp. NBC_00568]MCX4993671.1 AAA family ATPase [Streptomyces sp. NBC_00568]
MPCAPGSAAADAGRAEERKVVSVVFCDLVGSTAISGRLDPETLRSVTLRYFDLMRRQIESHGGTVEKFIGDAVMAVFGVPVTHEDDARRAVAAALDMIDALEGLNNELTAAFGLRLDVRIGVNSGEVVATSDASARQVLVSGEVVNVAARLEQNATAGQILIGPETLRAVGPAAVVEEVGPLTLKGKTQPVTAYRLLAVQDDDPELLRRFDIPFVGRETELAELGLVLDRVTEGRGCHLVNLYGEAGIGKTRLVREWLHRLGQPSQNQGRAAVIYGMGRCRPYGEVGSLAPLADALRSLLNGADGEECEAGSSRTDPVALTGPADRAEAAEALALLGTGLLRDGTPNPSLDDTCAALSYLLGALSQQRTLVLVVDDCHWADALLLEVLDRLVEDLDHAAVMVVCAARPELLDTASGWGSGRLKSVSLIVPGLSPEESGALAAGLDEVGAHQADPASDRVLERAEGNPLHLEQLLAMRGEGGSVDGLPPTVQALLAARVGALERAERDALDLASVVGREFALEELADLAAAAVHGGGAAEAVRPAVRRLTRRRLVEPARHRAGGTLFRFSSGLVQEVVYQAMAKRIRAERHESAADLLAARGGGDALTGIHLERAHGYRTELGLSDARTDDLRRRAASHLAAAGAEALTHADLSRAEDLLTRATALADPLEPPWPDAARRLAEARLCRGGSGEEACSLLRQALAAATASGDRISAAHARLLLASACPGGGPGEEPADAADAVLPVFEATGEALGLARARIRIAQRHQLRGSHAEAGRLLDQALRDAVQADAEPERAAALGAIGVSLWLGPERVADAVAWCRTLLAEHGGERRTVRVTLNCPLAVLLALQQRWDEARECLTAADRLARELGYVEASIFVPVFSAAVETLAGRPALAEELLLQAEAACRESGASGLPDPVSRELARLLLARGEWRQALERTGSDEAGLPPSEAADACGLRARVAALRGDPDEAARLAAHATDQAARTDSPIVRAVAELDRAHTFLLLGRRDEAGRAAREAGRWFAAKGHLVGVGWAASLAARADGSGNLPQDGGVGTDQRKQREQEEET